MPATSFTLPSKMTGSTKPNPADAANSTGATSGTCIHRRGWHQQSNHIKKSCIPSEFIYILLFIRLLLCAVWSTIQKYLTVEENGSNQPCNQLTPHIVWHLNLWTELLNQLCLLPVQTVTLLFRTSSTTCPCPFEMVSCTVGLFPHLADDCVKSPIRSSLRIFTHQVWTKLLVHCPGGSSAQTSYSWRETLVWCLQE